MGNQRPDAHSSKAFLQRWPKMPHPGHPCKLLKSFFDGFNEALRRNRIPFEEKSKVVDQVALCPSGLENLPSQACFLFRDLTSLRPSRRILSHDLKVMGVAGPLWSACNRFLSICILSFRFCSALKSSRRYSLAVPYPPVSTCSSIHSFMDSGNEI